MTSEERFRFVITLMCETEEKARTLEVVLNTGHLTQRISLLGGRVLNWIVDAPGPPANASELDRGAPQCWAADWHVKPVVAGLVALGLIEGVNWQSCRRVGPRGGLGDELTVI